jgi:AsmA family protein
MGDALLSALGVPVKTQIDCLVADFALTDGLVETKAFLIATKAANILGTGTVNLANERLAIQLRTQATHFSIGSLSTPLNISGSLKDPHVMPAAGPLAARAGPAVALGALFPPLALLPTIRLGLGDKNACIDTIASIRRGAPHNPG